MSNKQLERSMNLTEHVQSILRMAKWEADRDVSDSLVISENKSVFSEALTLMQNFGHLKVEFHNRNELETIYFDCDESNESRVLRANIFGYDDPEDLKLQDELDWMDSEDFELTNKICEQIGRCCRIGFYEDHLGHDIYIIENGKVYVAHGSKAFLSAENFNEFLNNHIEKSDKKQTGTI